MADFSYSEDPELQTLNGQVLADPEDCDAWERLVRAAETQEGGSTLNRNSSPQAIASTRDVYDRFLSRFPLFFGYWKKYADLEFSIAGPEAAEMVYERGVASIGISVDIWTNYCTFKSETNHDLDQIRELFERGANSVGLDFLSHLFWDKYLEFEGRLAPDDRSFSILSRIIQIPMHQYARYFERYRNDAQHRPISDLAPADVIERLRAEVDSQAGSKMKSPADTERELRTRLDAYHMDIFNRTQAETTKRWTFESEIKRPYFHVTDLDDAQLDNWRNYLDFENSTGDYERTKFLYERCLVTAANYDEFWMRYALWMLRQDGDHKEEVRNIYQRASCIFVPIARPAIRLYWAHFEEMVGRADVSADIIEAILLLLPSHLEAILALANLHRRQQGVEVAISTLKKYVDSHEVSTYVRGALVAEWARMVADIEADPDGARKIFASHQHEYLANRPFWLKWFFLEVNQPAQQGQQERHNKRVKGVYEAVLRKSNLPPATIKDVTTYYLAYLQERGQQDAMEEYVQLDQDVNGPAITLAKQEGAVDGAAETRPLLENGLAGASMQEAVLLGQGSGNAYYTPTPQPLNGQGGPSGY